MLYYTVTHNVSDNGSELAFNTTTNKAILNGASYGETYYISVCAINAIGKGKIATITFSAGKTIIKLPGMQITSNQLFLQLFTVLQQL